jgi:transcriptional regulator with XRE-family HTH domain
MYSSKETAQRIKTTAKLKKVSIATLQQDCGLSKNAINQLPDHQEGMDSKSIYAVAEYLNVSTDYLLGRAISSNEYSIISTGDISGDHNANMNFSNARNKRSRFDSTTRQVAELFQSLDVFGKAEVMSLLTKLSKGSYSK